jgi:hypothetical protein
MIRTGHGCRPFGFRNKPVSAKTIALGVVYLGVGESEVGHTSTKSRRIWKGCFRKFSLVFCAILRRQVENVTWRMSRGNHLSHAVGRMFFHREPSQPR